MSGALLQIDGLTAGYGPVQVLNGIDLTVDDGEIVVILGANGAGKTTTMRSISGMIPVISDDCGQNFTALAGDSLSGSGNTISKAIVAAPRCASVSMSLASSVRGQGHWPSLFKDSSSMSTMRTGRRGSNVSGAIR